MFKRQSASKRVQASQPTQEAGTPPIPAARRTEEMRVESMDQAASTSPTGEVRPPSREQVAIHAYHLWRSRGEPFGTDWEDWLEAERQLATMA